MRLLCILYMLLLSFIVYTVLCAILQSEHAFKKYYYQHFLYNCYFYTKCRKRN